MLSCLLDEVSFVEPKEIKKWMVVKTGAVLAAACAPFLSFFLVITSGCETASLFPLASLSLLPLSFFLLPLPALPLYWCCGAASVRRELNDPEPYNVHCDWNVDLNLCCLRTALSLFFVLLLCFRSSVATGRWKRFSILTAFVAPHPFTHTHIRTRTQRASVLEKEEKARQSSVTRGSEKVVVLVGGVYDSSVLVRRLAELL